MEANNRLSVLAFILLLVDVVAASVAVAFNWPSQFGGVGTDAGEDLLTRGTAISAPLAPVVALVLTAILVRSRGPLGWVGIGLACLTAVLVFVGGFGEFVAEPTDDTPRGVLVPAGIVWCLVAVLLVLFSIAAARERLANRRAASARSGLAR